MFNVLPILKQTFQSLLIPSQTIKKINKHTKTLSRNPNFNFSDLYEMYNKQNCTSKHQRILYYILYTKRENIYNNRKKKPKMKTKIKLPRDSFQEPKFRFKKSLDQTTVQQKSPPSPSKKIIKEKNARKNSYPHNTKT